MSDAFQGFLPSQIDAAQMKDLSLFVNATPHPIKLYVGDKEVATIPVWEKGTIRLGVIPSAKIGAVSVEGGSIPIYPAAQFSGLEGPLEHALGKNVLVSMPVGQWIQQNKDLDGRLIGVRVFGPDSGPQGRVSDAKGNIIGTKALVRYL